MFCVRIFFCSFHLIVSIPFDSKLYTMACCFRTNCTQCVPAARLCQSLCAGAVLLSNRRVPCYLHRLNVPFELLIFFLFFFCCILPRCLFHIPLVRAGEQQKKKEPGHHRASKATQHGQESEEHNTSSVCNAYKISCNMYNAHNSNSTIGKVTLV